MISSLNNCHNLNRVYLLNLLNNFKGKIFTVKFTKSNGMTRILTGRLSVPYKRKTSQTYNNNWKTERGFISVYEMSKKEYRTVNLLTVDYINCQKQTYFINN